MKGLLIPYCVAQECADLVKENAMVSGHQNIRQRIHFHANLKMEYHKTLEVSISFLKHKLCLVQLCCDKRFLVNG